MTSHPAGPDAAAPARDGEIAVVEEFQAAEQAGTAAAYRLFAARHLTHRLAREAETRARRAEAQDLPPTD